MAFICPQSTVDKLEKEKMPRKGGRWWFSWRRRDFPAREVSGQGQRAWSARQGVGLTGCMFFPQSSAQTEKTTAREQQG